MKKILLMVVVAMMATLSAEAQNNTYKHEVAVSYGAMSTSDWITVYESLITAPFKGKDERENETYYGPIALEYFYHLDKTISVGGVFAFGRLGYDIFEKIDGERKPRGEMSNCYYTLLPTAKFSWYTNKFFGFYSKAGIGLTLRTEKDDQINYSESKMHVNYLLTLAGIELGSPQVRVFADFGLGEQGILCAGLRFKF